MVELYLMRHGRAAAAAGMSDHERPLAPEGVLEIERVAAGLAASGVRFDRILTSPLVRAAQTARIVARAQPVPVAPEELAQLAGGAVPELLFRALSPAPDGARLLLVGHEPDMSGLAGLLLEEPAERAPSFAPGSIGRFRVDGLPPSRAGSLVWLLTARLAGELAG